ncbi:MAG: hypothetical protein DRJ66_05585 [Thermoprotei archaeon]|nr:MAG: hypothetical protein DRJ66_05585 [Thermoprotei archaeon]RLF18154.1 MAG: hypothetical protein DRZ82_08750 [Thermoprotei archaeon]
MNEVEILDVGKRVVDMSLKEGASEAEVYVCKVSRKSIVMYMGSIKMSQSVSENGIGIRAIVGRRVGFVYANQLNDLDRLISKAVAVARTSREDENWKGLPEPSEIPHVNGIYVKRLEEVTLEELVLKMYEGMRIMGEYKEIVPVAGEIRVDCLERAIVNSNGIELRSKETYSVAYLEVVARSKGYTTPVCLDMAFERTSIPNMEHIARSVCKKAVSCLKPERAISGKMPVILSPIALDELMEYTLCEAINAENVYHGRSYYVGKIGENVANENLTLEDNGILEGGFFTNKFDDEGVPHSKTLIIDRGILRSYIADTYYGRLLGMRSTGNATRIGGYKSLPKISPTNLVLRMPTEELDEIIHDVREGLLVEHVEGAHSSNPESGEFSVVAAPAWIVRNGELVATKRVMLSGNFYDILNRFELMSKEVRQVGHLIAGYVKISEVNVVA